MQIKFIPLVIASLYALHSSAQDSRSALPTSVKTMTSLKYNGSKVKPSYAEKLVDHVNKTYAKYQDEEETRSYVKRGWNIGRNSISFINVAVGPNLIKEVAFEAVDLVYDLRSKKSLEAFNYNMDNLAKAVIASNKDLAIDSDEFKAEMKGLFFETGIEPTHYPVLGRQFDHMIFDRLVESREDLENFKAGVGDKIANLEQSGLSREEAIKEIQRKLSVKDGQIASLESSQQELRKNLTVLELGLSTRMNEFVDATVEWHERVNQDIESINTSVTNNETKIKENTEKIKDIQNDLRNQQLTLDQHSQKIVKLQGLQAENRNLILSNRIRIDAMGSVLYGEASTPGKIEMLKKGLVKFESPQAQAKEISKLENLKSWEEFNRDLAMGREIVKFASNLGMDDKTAKDANKVIGALSVVGQFAVSYPSNPMGMLSAVNGAFSLFGEGQGSSPDPAIMAELAEIKQKLSIIDQKVDQLNEKADVLLERQYEFHIQNMRSFAALHEDIQRLEVKTDYVMKLISNDCDVLRPDAFSMMETMKERLLKEDIKLKDYNLLLMSFNNLLPKMLQCIDDNTASINLSSSDFILMNGTNTAIEAHQFKPGVSYLNTIYDAENASKNLNYLPIRTNSIWYLFNTPANQHVDDQAWQEHLINPDDLNQLVELYLMVMPYFLLEKDHNTSSYDIWLETDMEQVSTQVLIDRTNTQFKNLQRLLKLVDICFMQQSLLAGNKLFQHLDRDLGKSNTARAKKAYDAISDNQLMQLNLSTFLLNKYVLLDNTATNEFIAFFDTATYKQIPEAQMKEWSDRLKNNWTFLQSKENEGYALSIMVQPEVEGLVKKLILPIDLQSVLSNEVIYSAGSSLLLEAKEKIKDKIIEYEFQSFLNANPEADFTKSFNALFSE